METNTKSPVMDQRLQATIAKQIDHNEILTKISQSIIANEVALDMNAEIVSTNYHKKLLAFYLKKTQAELSKAEKMEYDKVFGIAEKSSSMLYDTLQLMIKEIVSVGLHNFDNITELTRAFKKDPKSIMGIANKINRTDLKQ